VYLFLFSLPYIPGFRHYPSPPLFCYLARKSHISSFPPSSSTLPFLSPRSEEISISPLPPPPLRWDFFPPPLSRKNWPFPRPFFFPLALCYSYSLFFRIHLGRTYGFFYPPSFYVFAFLLYRREAAFRPGAPRKWKESKRSFFPPVYVRPRTHSLFSGNRWRKEGPPSSFSFFSPGVPFWLRPSGFREMWLSLFSPPLLRSYPSSSFLSPLRGGKKTAYPFSLFLLGSLSVLFFPPSLPAEGRKRVPPCLPCSSAIKTAPSTSLCAFFSLATPNTHQRDGNSGEIYPFILPSLPSVYDLFFSSPLFSFPLSPYPGEKKEAGVLTRPFFFLPRSSIYIEPASPLLFPFRGCEKRGTRTCLFFFLRFSIIVKC